MSDWTTECLNVLYSVFEERVRQLATYGPNDDLEDGTGPSTAWAGPFSYLSATAIEKQFRRDYEDFEEETGKPTWLHLVREEVAEAFAEDDPARLEAELTQVAALCCSWIQQLRRRQ